MAMWHSSPFSSLKNKTFSYDNMKTLMNALHTHTCKLYKTENNNTFQVLAVEKRANKWRNVYSWEAGRDVGRKSLWAFSYYYTPVPQTWSMKMLFYQARRSLSQRQAALLQAGQTKQNSEWKPMVALSVKSLNSVRNEWGKTCISAILRSIQLQEWSVTRKLTGRFWKWEHHRSSSQTPGYLGNTLHVQGN